MSGRGKRTKMGGGHPGRPRTLVATQVLTSPVSSVVSFASSRAHFPRKLGKGRNNRSTLQPKTARYLCFECLSSISLLPHCPTAARDIDCVLRKEENKHSHGTKTDGLLLGPVEARRWTASKDFANTLSFYRGRNLCRCRCLASAYFDCGGHLGSIPPVRITGQ